MHTKRQIEKISQALLLSRGYNGFSYSHIAQTLGIKKASIHYYYAKKEYLVKNYITKNIRAFSYWIKIQKKRLPEDRLENFFRLYREFSNENSQICPLGMLGAEYPTLPKSIKQLIKELVIEIESWLIKTLSDGKNHGLYNRAIEDKECAGLMINALSGALNTSRIYQDHALFETTIKLLKKYIYTEAFYANKENN